VGHSAGGGKDRAGSKVIRSARLSGLTRVSQKIPDGIPRRSNTRSAIRPKLGFAEVAQAESTVCSQSDIADNIITRKQMYKESTMSDFSAAVPLMLRFRRIRPESSEDYWYDVKSRRNVCLHHDRIQPVVSVPNSAANLKTVTKTGGED
jgi:hypothetical protein